MLPHQAPSEIVFPVSLAATDDPCVFRYDHGPVKLKAPRRRGRPLGSTKKPKAKDPPPRAGGDTTTTTNNDADFHFINMAGGSSTNNPSKISDETRATIRKHAMNNYVHRKRKGGEVKRRDDFNTGHEIHDVDPFNAFPIKLEPYMLDLLKYYMTTIWRSFYTIESYTSYNPMSDYCLPLAFYDSALLHLLIGCADSHASRLGHFREQAVGRKHMYQTIVLMKTRIATLQSVTDETITVVATLAYVEKLKGSSENWRIHMAGLKRLVDLRGGLISLESKPILMFKIFRADLCGSIDNVQIPFFSHRCPSSLSHKTTENNTVDTIGFKALDRILVLDERIKQCINSINEATHQLASLMENNSGYTAAVKLRFLITAAQYRLLSMEKYSHPLHELCRLAVLLYSESLVNPSPPLLPICDQLAAKLRDSLNNFDDNNDTPNDHNDDDYNTSCSLINKQQYALPLDFRLWSLFVAASTVSSPNRPLMEWYLRSIADIAFIMDIDSWHALVAVIGTFLFDRSVQGRRYLEIWNDARELREKSSDFSPL